MLDGVQRLAPAADEITQILSGEIHPEAALSVTPCVGHGLRTHVLLGKVLDGVQRLAPAADEITQILSGEIHPEAALSVTPCVGHGLRTHVLQQTLQESLDLLLVAAGLGRLISTLGLGLGFCLGGRA